MKYKLCRRHYHLLLILVFAATATTYVEAQQTQPQTTDVIKVNTELVQTAVTVVDKDGHFVEGLDRDKFQLLIDGQMSVDHSFLRSPRLGYWIFSYKAKRGANGGPNVSVQSAVLRDGRTVLNGPIRKLAKRRRC